MHEPAGPALLVWLETTGFAAAMRQWLWLYPAVEIVHLAGLALLVGGVALVDLRVLGPARPQALRELTGVALPWAWFGLALLVPSGLMMFSAHATELAANPAFLLKLALIAGAGVNAVLFHRTHWVRFPAPLAPVPAAARIAAGTSLALWLGVIACGRLIAYL